MDKKIFSSGVESATLFTSSNLLRRPLEAIMELYGETTSNQKISFKVKKEVDLTVIAFVTTPICTHHHLQSAEHADLVSSSVLKENNFPHFEFLCNKKFPSVSVNKAAISLFCDHLELLQQLKSQIDYSKPLIITGHALGGSIASLFTLSVLDSSAAMASAMKRPPLCITFGSPLLGDTAFQRALSRSSTWNSCFVHVASLLDPLPASFLPTNQYKPFGTFLLCSHGGSACLNHPDSVLDLLAAASMNQAFHIHDYVDTLTNLHSKAICKALPLPSSTPQSMLHSDSLEATIITQLLALGLSHLHQQVVENMKQRETKTQTKKDFDPSKKLNQMKINMAKLEWYKKRSKDQETGMYDMYKNQSDPSDQDIMGMKKDLTLYWMDMVEEAETRPQKEGSAFRTRWLFAATNCRRMVEPLEIADYYGGGGRQYETRGRSKHYVQIEQWLKQDTSSAGGALCTTNKQRVGSILTLDSCFWARVEEAVIDCAEMKTSEESSRRRLSEFEDYVYGLLKNYAVSPEIFLRNTTYMRWWNQYDRLMGNSTKDSKLGKFMKNPVNYELYAAGKFDFP